MLPADFAVGRRVRLRRDSQYAYQSSEDGTVLYEVPEFPGWAHVRFDDTVENNYRTGLQHLDAGVVDLMPIGVWPKHRLQ